MITDLATAVACRERGINPADYDEFPLCGGGLITVRHHDVVEYERNQLSDGFALTEWSEGYITAEEAHYGKTV